MKKLTFILDKIIEWLLLILLAAMVVGNFWQIFTRFVLNNAASWTEEFLRYSLIWLTMLGVPYAYSRGQHIAIEFIVNTFSIKGKRLTQIFIEVLILCISVFVMIIGGIMVTINASGQVSPALGMPMQFYYSSVPVCGILMIIYTVPRLINQIFKNSDDDSSSDDVETSAEKTVADLGDVSAETQESSAETQESSAESQEVSAGSREVVAGSREVSAESQEVSAESREVVAEQKSAKSKSQKNKKIKNVKSEDK